MNLIGLMWYSKIIQSLLGSTVLQCRVNSERTILANIQCPSSQPMLFIQAKTQSAVYRSKRQKTHNCFEIPSQDLWGCGRAVYGAEPWSGELLMLV